MVSLIRDQQLKQSNLRPWFKTNWTSWNLKARFSISLIFLLFSRRFRMFHFLFNFWCSSNCKDFSYKVDIKQTNVIQMLINCAKLAFCVEFYWLFMRCLTKTLLDLSDIVINVFFIYFWCIFRVSAQFLDNLPICFHDDNLAHKIQYQGGNKKFGCFLENHFKIATFYGK